MQFTGPYAVTADEANLLTQYAFARLREVKVFPKIIEHTLLESPCALNSNVLDQFKDIGTFKCLQNWVTQNRPAEKAAGEIFYFMLPPKVVNGVSYTGGLGTICPKPWRGAPLVAMGHATEFKLPELTPRLSVVRLIEPHEIGHIAGAQHDPASSCYMMDTYGAFCLVSDSYKEPEWSILARRRIANCNRLRYRWSKRQAAKARPGNG